MLTRSRPDKDLVSSLPPDCLVIGDAVDPETVAGALEGIEKVVFAAGGLLPVASEKNPELDAELTLGPLRNVLMSLQRHPETRFVYLSSGGTVYGEPRQIPVKEDAETQPIGVYGRLHLQCEAEVLEHRRRHGLRARILRCATVYGERQLPERGQGAVVTFLHRIKLGMPIELYGGGETIRDYLYVGDLARAVLSLVDCDDGPPILNVGSGRGTSLIELLRLVEDELGRPAEILQHPPRGFEVERVVLDITRLRGLIAFQPTPLEDGIARTRRWLGSTAPERV